jgi:multisubunit Na+/H+ antiporter MnhG subunit
MAYTLTDHFRPLRLIMRINGLAVEIVLGLLLLVTPRGILSDWGLLTGGYIWPLRLAGAAMIALGLFLLLLSSLDMSRPSLLLAITATHTLFALVLLVAYFQQEFSQLNGLGRILLIVVFVLCLAGAVTPLRYLRAEYRY